MNKNRPFQDTAYQPKEDGIVGKYTQPDTSGLSVKADLAGKFCSKPYEWLEIDKNGNCWLCCPTWLPVSIGNVFQNSLQEIWSGEIAQAIRNTMAESTFTYCNPVFCPEIASGSLPSMPYRLPTARFPKHINFAFDESCNLKCPSCRISSILHAKGEEYERRLLILQKVKDAYFAQPHQARIRLVITGSGDPFGSKVFRDFLTDFDPTPWPNLRLSLLTNGVMLTPKMWNRIERWHSHLDSILISFDAGSKAVYDVVRAGGDWDQLLENCDFLNAEKQKHRFTIRSDFVVQDLNFREMPLYTKMITDRFASFDQVAFSSVSNWGTWDTKTFEQRAIWKTAHPDHQALLDVLRSPELKHPKVNLQTLAWLKGGL